MTTCTHDVTMRTDISRPGHMVPGWRCSAESVELAAAREAMLEDRAGRRLVAIAVLCVVASLAAGGVWIWFAAARLPY